MKPPTSRQVRLITALLAAVLWAALAASPAAAQYFGRNKVQYRTFDFQVLRTEHFDIYFYPAEEAAARDAARMAERWYARLSSILNYEFEKRQPIIFYANHAEFQQTDAINGSIGEGTGGVTEAFKQRVIMPFTGTYQETDHVLGHELVHAFQYDISGLGRAGGGITQAAQRFQVPLWFIEGMAEYLSVGPVDAHTAMWLRDAALTGDIPSIQELSTNLRFFPYRWGQALWAYVGGRWGDPAIGQILKLVGQGVPYPAAFQQVLGVSLDQLSDQWATAIRRTYLPLLADRPEAQEIAIPLITHKKEGGRRNVAPAISPDGRYVAFVSELDLFDYELWLADAQTGEVIRRLVKGPAQDPHFGSLRFIASAGTFSPDGSKLAFSALRKGRDVLVIVDVERGRILEEIPMPDVPEITNPTWSPDGRTVVFSGTQGGISDLWAYDLVSEQTTRLTDDVWADLMPAFSPDGRTIAFVTDRSPTADLSTLRFGGYDVALLDLETREIRLLPHMEGATDFNPAWARDGQGLYFVSNRSGVPNIYRLHLPTGDLFQVTKLFGGVTGITDLSPALAVAQRADQLVFTSYERGGYNIYKLNDLGLLSGQPAPPLEPVPGGAPLPAILPPVPRPEGAVYNRVQAYLADPLTGLPEPARVAQWEVHPYRPSLSLDYLGQPQVGISTGGGPIGGGGVYGGITGIWSDLLGRHTVWGALQAQGDLEETGFAAMYMNSRTRWNVGAVAQRAPYVGLTRTRVLPTEDEDLVRYQPYPRVRTFDTQLTGIAQYPLSIVTRLEFQGGVRRISQDLTGIEYILPVENGRIVPVPVQRPERFEENLEAYNLVEGSAAFVHDASLLGYTSPFAGARYRFEVSPTLGDLQFTSALADYRKYFWFRPLTFALRGFHYGRYGRDAEGVFRPLYLGAPSLLRGYSYNSVAEECNAIFMETGNPSGATDACELAGQLFGSKLATASFELRWPVINSVVSRASSGLPPVEVFGFLDAGVAWDKESSPVFRRGVQRENGLISEDERGILTSVGVGARVNAFGYLILEVDYVNALDRDKGWDLIFAIQPGF